MSSDESDFDCSDQIGEKGYQWEPEYTEEEILRIESQGTDSSQAANMNERSADLNWCKCSTCTILPTYKECHCCKEFEYYSEQFLVDTLNCITEHPDFAIMCLTSVVLETAYIAFLRYKRQTGRAPDSLSPKQSRLMAYRQFVNWVRRGQPLGKKLRITLPSCVVTKIRTTFPDPDGTYEGYYDASSSDSNSD